MRSQCFEEVRLKSNCNLPNTAPSSRTATMTSAPIGTGRARRSTRDRTPTPTTTSAACSTTRSASPRWSSCGTRNSIATASAKPYAPFAYYESSKNPEGIGSVSNKYDPSKKSGHYASISSRITAVILITVDRRVDYNCFNEPFAV